MWEKERGKRICHMCKPQQCGVPNGVEGEPLKVKKVYLNKATKQVGTYTLYSSV